MFAHLHCHSEYSLLDGLPQIGKFIKTVKELGMDSVALTDHGVMHGAIEFYKEAVKEGIHPVIGMEGYVTVRSHFQKAGRENLDNFHITLLAKNITGYKNLMKITSIGHIEGFYYRPRVDKETLRKYSEGIICLSGCGKGELASAIKEENSDKIKEVIHWYQETFGAENYFLEIQKHEYSSFTNTPGLDPKIKSNLEEMAKFEKHSLEKLVLLSRQFAIPLVATNDAHYATQTDAFAQDVLVCISTGKNVTDINRLRYVDTPTFYLRPESEMRALFPELPEAIDNSVKIASLCQVEITLGKWFFPKFDLPEGKSADEALKDLAYSRLKGKIPETDEGIYERMDYELDVIAKKGYSPYFLIVEDFVSWAKNRGIITNTRGSAAGSLVSYVIGVTSVNPLTYFLPFERFLNPYRPSPPDIDFDVADNRREEIINYLVNKYGKEKVAQICTFGRMLARAAARDVARVLGYPYSVGDKIAKLIPLGSQGFPMNIERALKESPDLASHYASDSDAKRILDTGKTIEGNARHMSVHAAGVVVAPFDLTDFTPLSLDPSSQEKIITQYEMHACEDVGLIKFDILGIRNLSILGAAVHIVEKTRGEKINLAQIALDDSMTFEMLSRGETFGTFQLGGSAMTHHLQELKPSRVEDLMAMVALFRPGPMAVIPEYIARKHNPKLVKYLDPRMEKYLDMSYGMLVYQDDLLYTAIYLAGYSWEEADKFRKAVGKKIPAEMAKQKEKFVNGIIENGRDKKFADDLWKLFEPFQAYGFNKAHAASYGMVAYQTAYMKAHFPVEFMCALLTAESGDSEKISQGVYECRRIGIIVEPPDINLSQVGFTIEDNSKSLQKKAIRFGLNAIKNVGEAAIGCILEAKKKGLFVSLTDFCNRNDGQKVNRKVLESLIRAGAMDKFGKRSAQLSVLDKIKSAAEKKNKDAVSGQKNLFGDDKNEDGMPQTMDLLPQIDELSKRELQTAEKELLGFYLSDHPLIDFTSQFGGFITHKISDITVEDSVGQEVVVGGVVTNVRILLTKKDSREMAFGRIEDLSGKSIEVTVFPSVFDSKKSVFAKDKLVMIEGRIDSRDDQLSIIARKILAEKEINSQSLDQSPRPPAPKAETEILIPKNTSSSTLLKISQLFQENRGDKKIILVFQNGDQKKKMPLPFGVNLTPDLMEKVNSLLAG